ncbi:MAG: divalent-cation tolerance protein CutA [Methylovirgula sp.]|jgi:periplasmic divalent cation tolerance protein
MAYAVLLTSLPDRAAAKAMAQALIAKRLVACVQMMPIESVYEWQGAVEEAAEVLLLCKMKREDYAEAEKLVLAQNPYETPEVVLLPIEAGSSAYLAWIDKVTK